MLNNATHAITVDIEEMNQSIGLQNSTKNCWIVVEASSKLNDLMFVPARE